MKLFIEDKKLQLFASVRNSAKKSITNFTSKLRSFHIKLNLLTKSSVKMKLPTKHS